MAWESIFYVRFFQEVGLNLIHFTQLLSRKGHTECLMAFLVAVESIVDGVLVVLPDFLVIIQRGWYILDVYRLYIFF